MVTLGGGGKDDLELGPELAGGESLDHFVVSPGVEQTCLIVFDRDEFAEGHGGGAFGKVVFAHHDEGHLSLHVGESLQHGGSHAGEALVRIA